MKRRKVLPIFSVLIFIFSPTPSLLAELLPSFPPPLDKMASQGKYREIFHHAEKRIRSGEREGKYWDSLFFLRGYASHYLGKREEGCKDFQKALARNPQFAPLYFYLSFCREEKGDLEGAILSSYKSSLYSQREKDQKVYEKRYQNLIALKEKKIREAFSRTRLGKARKKYQPATENAFLIPSPGKGPLRKGQMIEWKGKVQYMTQKHIVAIYEPSKGKTIQWALSRRTSSSRLYHMEGAFRCIGKYGGTLSIPDILGGLKNVPLITPLYLEKIPDEAP